MSSAPPRQRRTAVALLVAALLPLVAGVARAADPLPGIVARKPGNGICFRRDYDAAHLRQHPGQRIASVLMSVRYGREPTGVWMRARLRQDKPARQGDVFASCDWSEQANRDTSDKPLIPAYGKEAGFACISTFNASSAEEAGDLLFDVSEDGRSAILHFPDQIGLWDNTNAGGGRMWKLGGEDRRFRLDRTDNADCRDLDTQLPDQ